LYFNLYFDLHIKKLAVVMDENNDVLTGKLIKKNQLKYLQLPDICPTKSAKNGYNVIQ